MKKLCVLLTILLLGSILFASTTDVFKTTTEISAYKKLVPTDTLVEEEDPPESITLRIMNANSGEVSLGGSSFSETISSNNYNTPFESIFVWEMTGNILGNVSISFAFSPLYSGILDVAGSQTVSDASTVIPYTVTMNNSTTQVYYNSQYRNVGDTKLSSASGSYEEKTSGYYTYRIYYADKKTFQNSVSSVKITTSGVGKTITESFNLNDYSYYTRKRNNNYNSTDQRPFTTCNGWKRQGYASVQLHLNQDVASWTDTDGQTPVTYMLPNGNNTYTANVTVTISVD